MVLAAGAIALVVWVIPATATDDAAMLVLDGTWERLTDPPFGSDSGAGVWTGETVLVVDVPTGRVASYDMATGTWTELSDGPEGLGPERLGATSPTVWTGRELVLFDSMSGSGKGYAFDPEAPTWREIAPVPIVEPRVAVLAGGLVVVGNRDRAVAAYDPDADAWTELPRAPGAKRLEGLFWSGTEILAVTAPNDLGGTSVALLDLDSATWGSPNKGPLSSVISDEGLWVGDELMFASGTPNETVPGQIENASFNPSADAWTVLDLTCPIGSELGVWTGELVVNALGLHAFGPATGQCDA